MKKKLLLVIVSIVLFTVACGKNPSDKVNADGTTGITPETETTSETKIASEKEKTENNKAYGTNTPNIETPKNQIDYSGKYTDKQGTTDIYSELELQLQADGSYAFTMGIYRLTTFDGIATYKDGELHFVTDEPTVEGNIVINGDNAEVTITKSISEYINVGDTYNFPDGKL